MSLFKPKTQLCCGIELSSYNRLCYILFSDHVSSFSRCDFCIKHLCFSWGGTSSPASKEQNLLILSSLFVGQKPQYLCPFCYTYLRSLAGKKECKKQWSYYSSHTWQGTQERLQTLIIHPCSAVLHFKLLLCNHVWEIHIQNILHS